MSEREEVCPRCGVSDAWVSTDGKHLAVTLCLDALRDRAATAERERDGWKHRAERMEIDHADALDAYRQMYESERDRAERAERQLSEVRLLCDEWPNYIALNVLNILDAAEGTP